MEEAKPWARKEIIEAPVLRIDGNLVSWSASSASDDEEFTSHLKSFISVTMATEEKTGLAESHKRVGKVKFGLFVWADHPTVCGKVFGDIGAKRNNV